MSNKTLTITKYHAGSYIIIENQPNSKNSQGSFFIIRSGKVRVNTLVDKMLGTENQILGPGGFFGVIAAMSSQQSNETAVALTDCAVIVVKRNDFGHFFKDAPAIALKIIRSLSNDLRYYNNELAKRMWNSEHNQDNLGSLFKVGEYFYQLGNKDHACKIFSTFLKISESTPLSQKAKEYINALGGPIDEPSGFSRIYQDGEMICAEYMPGSELYIIQKGKVKITKIVSGQESLLAILETGDIVGEMSLLNDKDRTANIIAHGTTKIMAVNKENFEKIIGENIELAVKLLTLLSGRLWVMYKQLANQLIENPLTRLWDTLFTQLLKNHVTLGKRINYQFSLGKEELLNLSGLQAEEGEKAFSDLMRENSISLEEEGILCSNLEELGKIVESAHRAEIRMQKMRQARNKKKDHIY